MDWLWDQCREWMVWFGLLSKKATITIVGLDNAGKTTLLGVLASGTVRQHIPTPKLNNEEVAIGNLKASCYDLGGAENQRYMWGEFHAIVDAVIFVIDASDTARIEEAKDELSKMRHTEALEHVPFLVLGNKIDRPEAVSEEELRFRLELPQQSSTNRDGGRATRLVMCSIACKDGYGEGLSWLAEQI